MASSIDKSTPSSSGKAVVFLKASKGNDDPYAVVRHTDKPMHVTAVEFTQVMNPDISLVWVPDPSQRQLIS
jgi:hypothetical protein